MAEVKVTKKMVATGLVAFLKGLEEDDNVVIYEGGEKPITYGDAFEYLEREIELLSKKRSGGKKAEATKVKNDAIKVEILATLEGEDGMTVSDIYKAGNFDSEVTTQKITAMLRQLKDEGKVDRRQDKKKTPLYYLV